QAAHEAATLGVKADHDLPGHVEIFAANCNLRRGAGIGGATKQFHGVTLPEVAMAPIVPSLPYRLNISYQPQALLGAFSHHDLDSLFLLPPIVGIPTHAMKSQLEIIR